MKSKYAIRYTKDQIAKMVSLAQELGSARKAAKQLGASYQTVLEHCHKEGIQFVSVKMKSQMLPSIVVDGFRFTKAKNFYRGKTDHGRESLSNYLYRKTYGTDKPEKTCILFKDGNNDNYSPDNIEFVSLSDWMRIEERKRHDENVALLDAERKKYFDLEKDNPHLMRRRMHRMWVTRRTVDPDNTFAIKAVETKRKNAEERGYWYTDDQIKHMSDAHKGKSSKVVKLKKHEDYKASIRRKMGIAV